MSTKPIDSAVSTQLNPFGPQWPQAKQTGETASIGQQVQAALFGRTKPPVLDPALFPGLAYALKKLFALKKKLATMAGDEENDYQIVLADGTIGMIDAEGVIYIGAGFLAAYGDNDAVLAGVLAHEIGHRPKRWHEYQERRELTKRDLEELCRYEETRADIFSGKALAELQLSSEPLVEFLQKVADKPHPDYFPADVRAEVIRDAHAGREYRVKSRKKLFSEFDRMTSPKGHLGDY